MCVSCSFPRMCSVRLFCFRISIEDVKSALSTKIDAKKIVGLRLARDRNVFVYLKDEDTLNVSCFYLQNCSGITSANVLIF